MTIDRPTISVGVASGGRETLRDTILSAQAAIIATGEPGEIVIADDSLNGLDHVIPAALTVPLRVMPVGARNIAAGRNVCLRSARGAWLAFIDDDEVASVNWLTRLLAVQAAHGADIVCGSVDPWYSDRARPRQVADHPYRKVWGTDGAIIRGGSTSNVLLGRDAVLAAGLTFDVDLGKTGGEDTDFFWRARAAGLKIVAAASAIVREHVPDERLALRYRARRSFQQGRVYGHLAVRHGMHGKPALLARAAASLTRHAGLVPILFLIRPRSVRRHMVLAADAFGKLAFAATGRLRGQHH